MKPAIRIIILLQFLCPFLTTAKDLVSFTKTSKLCFIENKGQVKDQYGNPRNDIQFKIPAANGLNIFIGKGQLHYQWSKSITKQKNAVSVIADSEQQSP